MLQLVGSAAVGFLAKASCDMVPKVMWRSNSFKLSFFISSFEPSGNANSQRPFVTVACGDKKKKTEVGSWSQEQREWQFREAVTLEVSSDEEITISVGFSQQYDLVLAAVEMGATLVGEICFPVSSVLPKLKAEEREMDGLIYTTQVMGFDVLNKGAKTGRVYVSMDTRHPPSQRSSSSLTCNAIADKDYYDENSATQQPSSRQRMHKDVSVSDAFNAEHYRPPSSRNSLWG